MTEPDYSEVWARAQECFDRRPDTDMRRHAESVVALARQLLARGEPGRPEIVMPAAILHDIGIPRAIELYGSGGPPGQEVESALLAREILAELGYLAERVEAVCGIIALHHHRPRHATPEFRVVYDADLLVNAQEGGQRAAEIVEQLYTDQGRRLAGELLPP
jgi:HD superfamily phosphodiesterase